ncbi:uncharacterized protein [Leptinotarsa decemlineata]|uniref:uncharacterized protein n=1 Tax=Leptinotarsa decemlineata TaxID=7539 RepID=UPI003D30A447
MILEVGADISNNMKSSSDFWKRPLTLNELLEEADDNDITDEDSGDECNVDISNLPGEQLRANAEVTFDNIDSDSISDSDNDFPFSRFVKRKKMFKSMKEKNKYVWTKNDITSDLPAWDAVCGPKQQHSPVDSFFFTF